MSCITICIPARIDANPDNLNRYGLGRLRLQRHRSETSHDPSAIPSVAMGVLMELGVADPVPTLNAPPVSRQSQQGFWACAEAGEKEVFRVERLAVAGSCGGDLNDPACAEPLLATDVGSGDSGFAGWP